MAYQTFIRFKRYFKRAYSDRHVTIYAPNSRQCSRTHFRCRGIIGASPRDAAWRIDDDTVSRRPPALA